MARNAELVRQWEILRAIDAARAGVSVTRLAAERGVHPRTIRRDLEALGRAGFPLYDEKINGTPMWKLGAKPFQYIEEKGVGLTELAALYFGHAVLAAAAGPAFENDGERALMKLGRAVPAGGRRLADELPRLLHAKKAGHKQYNERRARDIAERALGAIVRARLVRMRYASASSHRTKEYVVEPHRLSYACGAIYLAAWVPEYGELRHFALERIETLGVEDERFERRPLPAEPFAHSLGAFSGAPESIAIEFDADVARYVCERQWHKSQRVESRRDGSIVLRLDVSIDPPLRRWVLGFGSHARVLAPAPFARDIAGALAAAAERYRRDGYRAAKSA